ncbi:MAG: hypothetical protein AVDCRST_MAG53-1365 [uncultured Solirubrobacteraceae bacterium]|uniref:Uncharacterized protein n=1 Tax=uncultured Solirubrobacteraceae bacterium TaxID=1162706 RepID=A0A6J4REQ9_9ACTN|nr:MAG: hypothetical protein AVDCRST_MAG53-1365 [uncultured Solirubrobacteraceae bacterium]
MRLRPTRRCLPGRLPGTAVSVAGPQPMSGGLPVTSIW